MTYVKTQLKREITIPAIITIHYFEYMKDFAFKGESHDFWEFLYVDKGNILVRAGDRELQMGAGDIVFHEPNEFHAFRAVGKSAINLVAVSFVTDSPGVDFFRKKSCRFRKKYYFCTPQFQKCPGGGIGRRARFRCVCRKACRFDSCPGHWLILVIG